jgi:hypothetical protein
LKGRVGQPRRGLRLHKSKFWLMLAAVQNRETSVEPVVPVPCLVKCGRINWLEPGSGLRVVKNGGGGSERYACLCSASASHYCESTMTQIPKQQQRVLNNHNISWLASGI